MKIFLMALCLFTTTFVSAKETKIQKQIPHEALKFRYQTHDGQVWLNCKHNPINEWYDWTVYCGDNSEKKFVVHLALSLYQRPMIPKNSYELLYWVTDQTDNRNSRNHGTTIWAHFKEPTDFHEFFVSLGVEDDNAALYLTLKPF